ncbi:MAG: Rieske 2Fe-2S domain-containing protein [Nitrososphaeraceae archaeon]|nr:Rieske 2Fe-2S domain-containing protein [Nitrososphaeraceae archaeon]
MLHKICNSTTIRNNSMKVFHLRPDRKVIDILIVNINGKFFACDNYCPHRGASLSKSAISSSKHRIICYLHDFEYNLSTGKLENIPSKWQNQNSEWKKSNDLVIYKIIEKENNIYVDIP